jgi:6-pyruvoyltetrahydropterin/6-carboxytetrahydropterin synthase
MGHRLWDVPGLCTQLHGHTWDVTLTLAGPRDERGLMLDYHLLKKEFRHYLDSSFDHRLCLHDNDPLIRDRDQKEKMQRYPGLAEVPFLPSTENLAELWAAEMKVIFGPDYDYSIGVWEGDKNWAEITIKREGS